MHHRWCWQIWTPICYSNVHKFTRLLCVSRRHLIIFVSFNQIWIWLHDCLHNIFRGFYAWNFDECMGNGPSNKFFPDWRGEEDSVNACILDDGTHTVPKGTPKYDTLQECCDTHYSWNSDVCKVFRLDHPTNIIQTGTVLIMFVSWMMELMLYQQVLLCLTI